MTLSTYDQVINMTKRLNLPEKLQLPASTLPPAAPG